MRARPLVLILESDEVARELYSRWFFAEGFDVMCAGGREGLLHVLRREVPALIVSELQIRDLSLSDLLKRLDSSEPTRLIPVLLLTSHPRAVDTLSRSEAQRVQVLAKYCDFRLLREWARNITATA
jgi:CheY-like chemotaxis protein